MEMQVTSISQVSAACNTYEILSVWRVVGGAKYFCWKDKGVV